MVRLNILSVLLIICLIGICSSKCCPNGMCSGTGFGCCGITRRACNFFCCNCDGGRCYKREISWSERMSGYANALSNGRKKRSISVLEEDYEHFLVYDANKDGLIDFIELAATMGNEVTNTSFNSLDKNMDGFIDMKEFDEDLFNEFS